MVSAKRWWVALLVVALLLVGSAAAWVFYGQPAPKVPTRARQVMTMELGDAVYWPQKSAECDPGIKSQILRRLWTGQYKSIDKEAK